MRFYAEDISGHLHKSSGQSWPDCLAQTPRAIAGGTVRIGRRYYITGKPGEQIQHWDLDRGFISFPTSIIGPRRVLSVSLSIPTAAFGAEYEHQMRLYSNRNVGFGASLEPADWDACDYLEGMFTDEPFAMELPLAAIKRYEATQFRLRINNEVDSPGPPEADYHIQTAAVTEAILMAVVNINTGNVNDDVAMNVAVVLNRYKTDIGASVVYGYKRASILQAKEIHVGWGTTQTNPKTGKQQVAVEVFFIEQEAAGAGAVDHGIDRSLRIASDQMRRALMENADCDGYCSGIANISEELADNLLWDNGGIYRGVKMGVTYDMAVGYGDAYPGGA